MGAYPLQPEELTAAWMTSTLRAAGELDVAIVHARAAVALAPVMAEAHNNMASVMLAVGDSEAAVVHYRRTLALVPGVLEVHRNLDSEYFEGFASAAAVPPAP